MASIKRPINLYKKRSFSNELKGRPQPKTWTTNIRTEKNYCIATDGMLKIESLDGVRVYKNGVYVTSTFPDGWASLKIVMGDKICIENVDDYPTNAKITIQDGKGVNYLKGRKGRPSYISQY